MKHRIWLVIPLLSLLGVSACSGDGSTPTSSGSVATTSPAVTSPGVVVTAAGLDGVEFVVHQAPG